MYFSQLVWLKFSYELSHLKILYADGRFSWAHQETNSLLFTITWFQPGGRGIGFSMFTAWLASISRSIIRRIRRVCLCTTQNYLNLHLLLILSSCNWQLVSSSVAPYLHVLSQSKKLLACPIRSVRIIMSFNFCTLGVRYWWCLYNSPISVVIRFELALAFANSNGSTQLSDMALNNLNVWCSSPVINYYHWICVQPSTLTGTKSHTCQPIMYTESDKCSKKRVIFIEKNDKHTKLTIKDKMYNIIMNVLSYALCYTWQWPFLADFNSSGGGSNLKQQKSPFSLQSYEST